MSNTTRQDNRPGWFFYLNDWLGNHELNLCSLKAQGLWIKMMCCMFVSPVRGELRKSNGEQITNRNLARLTGETNEEIDHLVSELYSNGVFSYTDDKIIYCRRMKREGEFHKVKQKAGQISGIIRNRKRTKDEQTGRTKGEQNENIEEEIEIAIEEEKDIVLKHCFILLQTVPDYNLNIDIDRQLLIELKQEHPDLDLPFEIKKWKTWLLDNKQKNKRLGLRNWMMKASQYKKQNEQQQKIIEQGKQEDKKQEERGKEALYRNATTPEKALEKISEIKSKLKGGGEE